MIIGHSILNYLIRVHHSLNHWKFIKVMMISHVAKVAGISSKFISKCDTGTDCTNKNNNTHITRGKHNTYLKLKFSPDQIYPYIHFRYFHPQSLYSKTFSISLFTVFIVVYLTVKTWNFLWHFSTTKFFFLSFFNLITNEFTFIN